MLVWPRDYRDWPEKITHQKNTMGMQVSTNTVVNRIHGDSHQKWTDFQFQGLICRAALRLSNPLPYADLYRLGKSRDLFWRGYQQCNSMEVSWKRGTPESSILRRFSTINHPFWGTTIYGTPPLWCFSCHTAHLSENGLFSPSWELVPMPETRDGERCGCFSSFVIMFGDDPFLSAVSQSDLRKSLMGCRLDHSRSKLRMWMDLLQGATKQNHIHSSFLKLWMHQCENKNRSFHCKGTIRSLHLQLGTVWR